MISHSENKKILIVIFLFILLLFTLIVVRAKRSGSLVPVENNISDGQQPSQAPTIDQYPGVLRILPSQTTVSVGAQSELSVEMIADEIQLDGADVIVRFDPAFLEVVDITTGEYFSQHPRKTIDNVSGTVKVTGFNPSEASPMDSLQKFFSFVIQGKKKGSGSLIIEFEKGKTSKSNLVEHITSKNILGRVENAMITVIE